MNGATSADKVNLVKAFGNGADRTLDGDRIADPTTKAGHTYKTFADKPLFYTAMGTGAGWGNDIPAPLRNGNWNYAVFTLDKKARPGVNQAECLACHKPLDSVSYTFTIKELSQAK